MGILNITPDSFSDGGLYFNTTDAVDHAKKLVSSGAEIIDIGAESSRPGSYPISLDEKKRLFNFRKSGSLEYLCLLIPTNMK